MAPPSCLPLRPITMAVLAINFIIFFIQVFQSSDWTNEMSNQPILTAYWHQPYRLFTSSWQHLSGAHIFFNMMFLVFIGNPVEAGFGSLSMLGMTLLFPIIEGLIYTYVHWFIYIITQNPHWLQIAVAGYSDNLFALLWLYCVGFGLTEISFFGLISIPARVYPFVLLILSGFGSSVSFVAHLSGIITGLFYHYGLLNYITVPRTWLIHFETETTLGRGIRRWVPNWVDTPARMNAAIELEQFAWTGKKCTEQPSCVALCPCFQTKVKAPLGSPTERSLPIREANRKRAGAQFVPLRKTNNDENTNGPSPITNTNNTQTNINSTISTYASTAINQPDGLDDDQLDHNFNSESENDDPELGLLGIGQQHHSSDVTIPPPTHYQARSSAKGNAHPDGNHSR